MNTLEHVNVLHPNTNEENVQFPNNDLVGKVKS